MSDYMCAYCASEFSSAASQITYEDRNRRQVYVLPPGPRGIGQLRSYLNGDSPEVEPGGRLIINGQYVDSIDPITLIDGTAVCYTHVFEALDRQRYGVRR